MDKIRTIGINLDNGLGMIKSIFINIVNGKDVYPEFIIFDTDDLNLYCASNGANTRKPIYREWHLESSNNG